MICKSNKETENLAVKLSSQIEDIKVLYLYGDLGSGKTTFTKAFVEALGIEKFYVKLCFNSNLNLPFYINNFSLIMNQIYKMKKFNLNEKNTFTFITDTLKNEAK